MTRLATIGNFIDGEVVIEEGGERFETINPATGETLAQVAAASPALLDAALASARRGFEAWRRMTGTERGRVLKRAADLLRARNDELARLEVLDTGKPIAEASTVDVASGADAIEYFAGVAPTIRGDYTELGRNYAYTRREPLGVCLGIGAWNYPLQIACWKSAPALAAGNAMIFKPSEVTPATAVELAKVYAEAGLPPGVFNVVQGDARVGAALVAMKGIAKVSLTGEAGTGRKVMAAAAETLKHVTLELGGKSPILVFADADLDNAVSGAILGNFYTQGEICSNGTRVFVERPVYEAFLEKLADRARAIRLGDPLDPATQMGALVSAEHLAKVMGYIEGAKTAGARLVAGGGRGPVPGFERGFVVEPTVFADCSDDMEVVREEIFGPVMAVLVFDTEEEAVERANATDYGLSAGVFTRDLARAHRVIAALEAGTCWVNTYNVTPVEIPFGGVKLSGIGRENGPAAIEHYTQVKSVYVETGDVAAPY